MTTKALFIHGINNEDNSKSNIEKEWSSAINRGITSAGLSTPVNVEFIAAFYGDVLHQEMESWGQSHEAATRMTVSSPSGDYVDAEVVMLYKEYQEAFNVTEDLVMEVLEEGEDPKYATIMAKGIHKTWIKAIARALESVVPSRGRYVAKAFLHQAAAYLHKPGLKERIDDIVRKQIFNGVTEDDNVVVISHSLGTVVAYALLRRLRHKVKAKLLLTMGSPLGLEIVKNRLGPPLICLSNVKEWVNVADREDFVALHPVLNKEYFGCDSISNNSDIDNGDEDAHSIIAYLSHPAVAKFLVPHL